MNAIIIAFSMLIAAGTTSCSWPTFYYFPRLGATPQKLRLGELLKSPFSKANQTIFVVHGYQSNYKISHIDDIRVALLKNTPENNVIMVDWSDGADGFYFGAAKNTKVTGKAIADFIRNNSLDQAKTYCVGHSLGAHTCGYAGKQLSGKMGRITGLDPAGPSFDLDNTDRLMPSNAIFVDVIHTSKLEGNEIPSGHLDFFPNFKKLLMSQPDCSPILPMCNHRAVCRFYAASTSKNCTFTSQKCTNVKLDDGKFDNFFQTNSSINSPMGYYASKNAQLGIYYVKTDKNYCQA